MAKLKVVYAKIRFTKMETRMSMGKEYILNATQHKLTCLMIWSKKKSSVSFAAKSYNVRMDGERPVIAAPAANTSPQSNNVFKCPKKVWFKRCFSNSFKVYYILRKTHGFSMDWLQKILYKHIKKTKANCEKKTTAFRTTEHYQG